MVTGTLNVSILEDKTVHRQYLRSTPYQDDSQIALNRRGELVRQPANSTRRARRR
jgi:hypothetical protein